MVNEGYALEGRLEGAPHPSLEGKGGRGKSDGCRGASGTLVAGIRATDRNEVRFKGHLSNRGKTRRITLLEENIKYIRLEVYLTQEHAVSVVFT